MSQPDTIIQVTPVILCGGSGTRLWPLSRTGFPKQFLCLTGNESLFQQAAQRLADLGQNGSLHNPNSVIGRAAINHQVFDLGVRLTAHRAHGNQNELINERAELAVFDARPGITGLAQVTNIDMSTPKLLAETDAHMLQGLTLVWYFKYILMTVGGKGAGDRVKS